MVADGLNPSKMGLLGSRNPPASGAPASPPASNITPPGAAQSGIKNLLGDNTPFSQAGMLSAALMGNMHPGSMITGMPSTPTSSAGGLGHHPPTPPRTPKTPLGGGASSSPRFGLPPDHLKMAGGVPPPHSMLPSSVASGMPPLLSLAAIQDQVGKGAPNILAAQLSKPPSMMIPGNRHW